MDELRESSLLFSIEGLLETERERVRREAREAERRREEEVERVADAAERRRLALESEREARARREALERERQRHEDERLEAMKRATVERARVEAEGRLRLVEAEEQRKHQLLLARLQSDARVSRYQTFSWLASGACVLIVAGSLGAYFGWLRPARAQAEHRYHALVAETRARDRNSEQALRLERARSESLNDRLRALESRPSAGAPPGSAVSPDAPAGVKPRPVPLVSGATSQGAGKKARCGDSGDPLDDCLR